MPILPLWGYGRADSRGLLIEDIINEKNLVLNDPLCLPTFSSGNLEGRPDLTLSTHQLANNLSSWIVDPIHNNIDHRYIITTLTLTV